MTTRPYLKYLFAWMCGALPLFLLPLSLPYFNEARAVAPFMLMGLMGLSIAVLLLWNKPVRLLYTPAYLYGLALFAAVFLSSVFSAGWRLSVFGFELEAGTLLASLCLLVAWATSVVWLRHRGRSFIVLFLTHASFSIVLMYHLGIITVRHFLAYQTTTLAGVPEMVLLAGLILMLGYALIRFLTLKRDRILLLGIPMAGALAFLVLLPVHAIWFVLVGTIGFVELLFRSALKEESRRKGWFGLIFALLCGVLLVSSFFIPHTIVLEQLPPVSPSLSESIPAAASFVLSHPVRALFGEGPNTFAYVWNEQAPLEANATPWWGTSFAHGAGLYDTALATMGVLGLLVLLIVIGKGISGLARRGFASAESLKEHGPSGLIAASVALFGALACIWYYPNLIELFSISIMCAIAVAFGLPGGSFRSIPLTKRRVRLWGGSGLLALVVILGAFLFFKEASVLVYNNGLILAKGGNVNVSQAFVSRAINMFPEPVYYRALSEIQQLRVNELIADKSLSEENLAAGYKLYAAAALEEAKIATKKEPNNMVNWIVLGNAYSLLSFAKVPGAFDQGSQAYDRAIALGPRNPLPLFLKARLFGSAGRGSEAAAFANQALTLKPDYAEAKVLLEQYGAQ